MRETSPTSAAKALHPSESEGPHHHRQPSVHAHFLMDDVVGHMGSRSRSGSASASASEWDKSDAETYVGMVPVPQRPSSVTNDRNATFRILRESHSPPSTSPPKPDLSIEGKGMVGTGTGPGAIATPETVGDVEKVKEARKPDASSQSTTTTTSANGTNNAQAPAQPNLAVQGPTTASACDPRLPLNDGKLHILLGATGSISTGKLRAIIHKLEDVYGKNKINIQLILTKAAEKFVSRGEIPSTVRIWRDEDEWATWRGRSDPVVHIELRRWADIFVVAPLSANTLGKIALGLCDNLLTNVIRAWNTQYPILIAPAMSNYAYNHPATKRHIKLIKEEMKWIDILKPVEKVVGSYGDIGMGGMMDWNEIVDRIVVKLGGYPDVDEDEEGDTSQILDDEDNDDDDDDNDEEDEDDEDDDDDEDEDGRNAVKLADEGQPIAPRPRRSASESHSEI